MKLSSLVVNLKFIIPMEKDNMEIKGCMIKSAV
jgi:hypothetical protein